MFLAILVYPLVAAASTADLRGIYVIEAIGNTPFASTGGQAVQHAIQQPGVDGVELDMLWASIQPGKTQFAWNGFDQWMNFVVAQGKKVTLVIRAGDGIPSWVFQPAPNGGGATPLAFTISPHEGKTNVCITETIAAPWDPAYLTAWDSLLAAVAAHLQSTGVYHAVTAVRLTGINRTSDELRLPAETAQSTGLSCVSNSIATWQQAGYRPSKLVQGWDAITSSFLKNFPDKSFSVAIITNPPQLAFPTIAEDGSVMTGTIPDQNAQLLPLAAQKLPGRLVVQFNFLLPGSPANPFVVQAAQTLGTMAAFQTNNFYSLTDGGAACGGSPDAPVPCDATSFLAMLETGIDPLGASQPLRAQYIELWPIDANEFGADLVAAHDQLVPPEHKRAARHH